MSELVVSHGGSLSDDFASSHAILSRAVSLPIGVHLRHDLPSTVREVLQNTLNV